MRACHAEFPLSPKLGFRLGKELALSPAPRKGKQWLMRFLDLWFSECKCMLMVACGGVLDLVAGGSGARDFDEGSMCEMLVRTSRTSDQGSMIEVQGSGIDD
ncbi:hypothetical protein LR48_Vigan09g074400 [Vigna angularis]|uniref:Uncharacterized protein n=1 Tax=Phaseolus angularis TaxID=3914 RepID=A0A0L9VAJ0_PHAAN|nr:hypothetical protein LR48_Vigan09g074400 [Vigna angularis]